MNKETWYVLYSKTKNCKDTTSNHTSFRTLKEARQFATGKSGYIIQVENCKDNGKLYEYFGSFQPCEIECLRIKSLTRICPECNNTGKAPILKDPITGCIEDGQCPLCAVVE